MLGESWSGRSTDWSVLPELASRGAGAAEPVVAEISAAFEAARIIDVVASGASSSSCGEGALMLRESARLLTAGHETYNYLHGPMEPLDARDRLPHHRRRQGDPAGAGHQRAGLSHPAGHQPDRRRLRGRPHRPAGCRRPRHRWRSPSCRSCRSSCSAGRSPAGGAWPWTVSGTTKTTRSWPRPVSRSISVIGNVQLDVLASPVTAMPSPGGDTVIDRIAVRTAGAAGNVSLALAALGAQHRLFGAVGDDDAGRWVASELRAPGAGGRPARGRGTVDRHLDRAGGARSGNGRSSPRTAS